VVCIPSGFAAVLSGGFGVIAEVAGVQADGTLTVSTGSTLTLDGDSTFANLTILDSVSTVNGAGGLTIPAGGRFTWIGGTLGGSGVAVVESGATLSMDGGCCNTHYLARNLTNNGSATWSGGGWNFRNTSTFQPTVTNNGAFTVDLGAGNLSTSTDNYSLPPAHFTSTAAGASFRIVNGSENVRSVNLGAVVYAIDGRSDATDPSHAGGRFSVIGTGTTIVAEETLTLSGDGLDLGTGNVLTTTAGGGGNHAITISGHLFGNSRLSVPGGSAALTSTADIDVDAVDVG
jgi:hypothetical protein